MYRIVWRASSGLIGFGQYVISTEEQAKRIVAYLDGEHPFITHKYQRRGDTRTPEEVMNDYV